jgi:2-succinyl-6-hydroxy-2,4-cyclohexadiene-1-carboxylate synthase
MSLLGLQRAGSGPVLVWLHGFTQTKDSGHQFRSILTGTREVLTIDLPGHGENAHVGASLEETATLLADVLPNEPFHLAGYSLGGRVALHFALRYPERLSHLTLVSATLGMRDASERASRRDRDNQLATHVEAVGTEAFLDEWLTQPMFAGLPYDPDERRARSKDAHGLATSLRLSGAGTQSWLGDEARQLALAATIIAGANDEKFVKEAALLNDAITDSVVTIIKNAGHAVHFEYPDVAAGIVLRV